MSDKVCPVCGAKDLIQNKEIQILHEPYGGQTQIEISNYRCSVCGSEGDFFNENEEIILSNSEKLKELSIKNILEDFNNNKISMSAIERALSLPQRTLTKWKNGVSKPSAAGLALIKYLRTFPWLLDVAENNFDYNSSQKIFLNSAMQLFLKSIDFNTENFPEAGIIATSQSAFLYMQLDRPVEYPGLSRNEVIPQFSFVNEQLQITT